ncbi:MAG TPA: ribosome small subunit-dependent GTPase A, partial [Bacilli bacterium]|nr:ribosome small subunit-dependent GTPase A [Bacilli bacterium]
MREGVIIKLVSGDYSVLSDNEIIVCKARGVFRHKEI